MNLLSNVAAASWLAALVLGSSVVPTVAASADPAGEWRTGDGSATIRISRCGGNYCGFVISAKDAGKDERNPDPKKRARSVIGIQVLFSMKPSSANLWDGTIYNAEDGLTYGAKMTVQSGQTLQIQGCVPNGGACGNETWSRVR
jgi:uncharacterized protein (DUF2147 family)